jgi:F-type H+-transporting ATPase subunit epsilon
MATTGFDLVTPAATLFSGQAEMIVCKTVDGEIAFLANHEPYIGALDPCLVRILGAEGADSEIRLAVHGGFVEVKDNHVIMLADIAQRPEEIDVAQAQQEEAEASSRAGAGGEPDRAAETEAKWAQARLEAARAG